MVNPLTPEHALARLAVTGAFHGTFPTTAAERLDRARELACEASPELVAKVAVHARERGAGRDQAVDLPALLVAHLAARDVATMDRVFSRVVDDGATLRSFVRFVRSGVTGRRSFGSAPKRAIRSWFAARPPEALFRQSIGQSPSMSDVIKMVRPAPRNDRGEADAVREALYGYLIGKSVDLSALPPLAKAFDAFKKGEGPVLDLPFEMLTALPLRAEHWTELVKRMTARELRSHLATLLHHGILRDPAALARVAAELADEDAIRTARTLPLAVLTALRAADPATPASILAALASSLEHATANVPAPIASGRVVVAPDVSGSMAAAFGTPSLRCVDVAALVAAVLLRRSPETTVLPFAYDVRPLDLDRRAPVLANVERIASVSHGNTRPNAALDWLLLRDEPLDLLVLVSDDRASRDLTLAAWDALRARQPHARLVLVDLRARWPRPRIHRPDVLHVTGFSDSVFDVLPLFASGDLEADHLRTIDEVVL